MNDPSKVTEVKYQTLIILNYSYSRIKELKLESLQIFSRNLALIGLGRTIISIVIGVDYEWVCNLAQ